MTRIIMIRELRSIFVLLFVLLLLCKNNNNYYCHCLQKEQHQQEEQLLSNENDSNKQTYTYLQRQQQLSQQRLSFSSIKGKNENNEVLENELNTTEYEKAVLLEIVLKNKIQQRRLKQQQQQQQQQQQYDNNNNGDEETGITSTTIEEQEQLQLQQQDTKEQLIRTIHNLDTLTVNMTKKQRTRIEKELVLQLYNTGFYDSVGHTPESALLRKYHLRKKKHKHGRTNTIRKSSSTTTGSNIDNDIDSDNNNSKETHSSSSTGSSFSSGGMMDVLFPGMKPEFYKVNEKLYIITDQVRSRHTHVPYELDDTMPNCPIHINLLNHFQHDVQKKKRHNNRSRNNLGVRLSGTNYQLAPYSLQTLHNQSCTILCTTQLEIQHILFLQKLITRQYRIHMQLDLLPILMRNSHLNYAVRGYPIGFSSPNYNTANTNTNTTSNKENNIVESATTDFNLYNHLRFTITYQRAYRTQKRKNNDNNKLDTATHRRTQRNRSRQRHLQEVNDNADIDNDTTTDNNNNINNIGSTNGAVNDFDGVYITGFDVYPVSYKHSVDGSTCTDSTSINGITNDPATYLPLQSDKDSQSTSTSSSMTVQYTYEVEWIESPLQWEDRWDVYLMGTPDDDIHIFAILNSLMVVLLLSGTVAIIMIRTLRKDIRMYNEIIDSKDTNSVDIMAEESGWKLLHGDVFRPPSYSNPILLSSIVGTGSQLSCSAFCTLLLSLCNIVNPIKKGQTLTAIISLFVLSGYINGYISARIYKFCNGQYRTINTITSSMALPGIFVTIFILLNISLRFEKASTHVSFVTLLQVFAMWVGISAPLVFLGSYIGYRTETISVPTKANPIARYVPTDMIPWYLQPPVSYCIGGVLPFGSVCIELYFIMSALWLHQLYYVMGFLLVVLLILAATCAQVSIVMNYLQLCVEDYNWWWKSFFNCASAGVYLFLYSLWFLQARLELVGLLSVTIYLSYMAMISLCFGLFCGTIGFLCSFWFNLTIYGALHKVD